MNKRQKKINRCRICKSRKVIVSNICAKHLIGSEEWIKDEASRILDDFFAREKR